MLRSQSDTPERRPLGAAIPIEPLSDRSMARAWREVTTRLRASQDSQRLRALLVPPTQPRRWDLVAAALTAAAVAGAAVLTLGAGPSRSRAPSHILTAASPSHLSLGEAVLDVAPESALTLSGNDEAEPVPSATPSRSRPPRERRPSRSIYEAAARLEPARPTAAIALYEKLETGSGSWAANALFAHARLEADLGHRAEAMQLLARYLSRFPTGPNASDARDLAARLHAK